MDYNPPSKKPTKSGVYPVRVSFSRPVYDSDSDEPAYQVTGYAYYCKSMKRWGANALTVVEAARRRYTVAYHYNTSQEKEWKDDRQKLAK
ncbi:MAG TPA: hypothetical protein VFM46_12525 [Pseudomonadales bacterium]|nr:hypothetical protein [Pseudomonadales bacterium]